MNDLDLDNEMGRLVAADPTPGGTPTSEDLARLHRRGRRGVRRRRATQVIAAAACAAVVGGGVLAVRDLGAGPTPPPALTSPSQTSASTEAPSPEPTDPADAEDLTRSVELPNGQQLAGELETGEILGDMLEIGRIGEHREVIYAARGDYDPSKGTEVTTVVSVGVRVDGELIRLMAVLLPADARQQPDGTALYDGSRLDQEWSGEPHYRLYGLTRQVDGRTAEVTVHAPGGPSRPVLNRSGTVLPGWTVFVDEDSWDPSWDVLRLAPLTVTLADGTEIDVRDRSWTG